jgi:hypothetical protein
MAGVVDRLLAQLPGFQSETVAARPAVRPAVSYGTATAPRHNAVTSREWLGVWLRLLLGLALSVTMAGWPYLHSCGGSLVGYMAAVLTVVFSGIWAAVSAWKHHIALPHVLSLVVVLYGFALLTAELLPRTGYAVERASWQCQENTNASPWSASSPNQSVRSNS